MTDTDQDQGPKGKSVFAQIRTFHGLADGYQFVNVQQQSREMTHQEN
jgi:hypothetical protein